MGLVGARLLAESGSLPQDTLIVSVESSRVLPGAEQGGGPVIRVGDAAMTFDADAEAALVRARESLRAGDSGVQVQRQLMSGGVCEASAFAHYGYRTTGIAFPLGNYHNGAPQGRGGSGVHRRKRLHGRNPVDDRSGVSRRGAGRHSLLATSKADPGRAAAAACHPELLLSLLTACTTPCARE